MNKVVAQIILFLSLIPFQAECIDENIFYYYNTKLEFSLYKIDTKLMTNQNIYRKFIDYRFLDRVGDIFYFSNKNNLYMFNIIDKKYKLITSVEEGYEISDIYSNQDKMFICAVYVRYYDDNIVNKGLVYSYNTNTNDLKIIFFKDPLEIYADLNVYYFDKNMECVYIIEKGYDSVIKYGNMYKLDINIKNDINETIINIDSEIMNKLLDGVRIKNSINFIYINHDDAEYDEYPSLEPFSCRSGSTINYYDLNNKAFYELYRHDINSNIDMQKYYRLIYDIKYFAGEYIFNHCCPVKIKILQK